jgi:hypothetical protein
MGCVSAVVPKDSPQASKVPTHLRATAPARRLERWRLITEFIEVWHGPLGAEDGFTEAELVAAEDRLGIKLPTALREWYALAGRRNDVWSRQDHLVPPTQLELDRESDILIVRQENQCCETWGIRTRDLNQEDPPIVEVGAGVQSSPTTSAFACQAAFYEVKFAPNVLQAHGAIPEQVTRNALDHKFSKCDLPDRYWVASPVIFYEGTDVTVETCASEWVCVAARGEEAIQQLGEEFLQNLERH